MNLDSLSIGQKIGQLFFIGIPGPELDGETIKLLTDISPGGVCLFARNIKEAQQTRDLLDGIREFLPVEPLLSLDQEGGLVDRLRRVMTPMPAANRLKSKEDANALGNIVGESIRLLGFNMDFAPVVDVVDEARAKFSNGLNSRAFGRSTDDVIEMATEFLAGLEANDMLGCVKHFPGLGAAEADSHEDLPLVSIPEDEMRKVDLEPYTSIFAVHNHLSVMVAHAAYPLSRLQEKDADGKLLPSSLNYKVVTTLLRDELGFCGVAITDDLEMGAILKNFGIGEACKMAINAGEDMLAICGDPDAIYDGFAAVTRAVESGEISLERIDRSLGRISELKSRLAQRVPLDLERLTHLSLRVEELNKHLN